jgi:hypothetical protein
MGRGDGWPRHIRGPSITVDGPLQSKEKLDMTRLCALAALLAATAVPTLFAGTAGAVSSGLAGAAKLCASQGGSFTGGTTYTCTAAAGTFTPTKQQVAQTYCFKAAGGVLFTVGPYWEYYSCAR